MKNRKFITVMVGLIILSACIYLLQIAIFHDSNTTVFYIFQDMAFLPLTIAVTTLIIGTLLDRQSKRERIESSRILSCSFFSIVGNPLMAILSSMLDENNRLVWDSEKMDKTLNLLDENRDTILIIASNPNLLEHESFTDLLWSVLHLREELCNRKGQAIPDHTKVHILNDAQRVFDLYIKNWSEYSEYTEKEYPYYFMSDAFSDWRKTVEKINVNMKH